MNLTIRKIASRNFQVFDGETVVTDEDGAPMRFKTKREAAEMVEAWEADAPDEDPPTSTETTPSAPESDETAPPAPDDIAAMDRSERLLAAKDEATVLSAWRADGQPDPRPATPILDWMADPTTRPKRQPKGTRTVRSAEDDARLDRIVAESREAGLGWWKVAAALNDAAVPTATGKPWRDTTAWQQGKRLELTGTRL